MLIKVLVFAVFFLIFSGEKPVSWNNHFKLSWKDFRGEAKSNTKAVAVTSSGITFSYSLKRTNDKIVDFETFVHAHFYPENSWYNKEKSDAYILAHEQLHFDITELHVRKLRKNLAELKVSENLKSELNSLHEKANSELRTMQLLYDEESKNSIDVNNQKKWITFVNTQLALYKQYSSK
ncbi:hypothetical protein SAMN03097699_0111 [Flavobacteriaceae bacterium MAR_2010_188]|nr:hypothetical protein SAMN03097699_0111 [Flavobacteriaceae bacterium MAR_2010_188]